jgi:hypothetical protein
MLTKKKIPEFVMLFVNIFVDVFVMQQKMGVEEEHFVNESTSNQIDNDFPNRWKVARDNHFESKDSVSTDVMCEKNGRQKNKNPTEYNRCKQTFQHRILKRRLVFSAKRFSVKK